MMVIWLLGRKEKGGRVDFLGRERGRVVFFLVFSYPFFFFLNVHH